MTGRPIPADVRDLLAKLLPRPASSFEGERLAKLAAIEHVLANHGLSMHVVVVVGIEASPQSSPPPAGPAIEDDGELDGRPQFLPAGQLLTRVDQAERRSAFLSDSSRGFLHSMCSIARQRARVRLSYKQNKRLAAWSAHGGGDEGQSL
jgi:hypothetical protein